MKMWFAVNLGDALLAGESLALVKSVFNSEYEKANESKEMAVFTRHESEGRLQCEVKVYLTPASIIVAEAVGATPCIKPSADGLSMLAGSEACWSVFFPER